MSSRHRRIQVPRDPDLEKAIRRGRELTGPDVPVSQIVKTLAIRGADALDEDEAAVERSRRFLIDVAEGRSGLDLEGLRTVRDRSWR
jgi:hypothetical protein